MTQIRVMIVDDLQDTREDIKRLLHFEEDIQVVAEAGEGIEAVSTARDVRPCNPNGHQHQILTESVLPNKLP